MYLLSDFSAIHIAIALVQGAGMGILLCCITLEYVVRKREMREARQQAVYRRNSPSVCHPTFDADSDDVRWMP